MNRLPLQKQISIVSALVEGNSLRSTTRMVGVSVNTVTKLLVDLGAACSEYQNKTLHGLRCKRVQVDEIWSFCYSKQKNIPDSHQGEFGYGDVWTWTAICADTKLVPSWFIGNRTAEDAKIFIQDLGSRLSHRIQLTSDGHKTYLDAIENTFGSEIDYAMLVKIYGQQNEGEKRYSPSEFIRTKQQIVTGQPNTAHVSTSYVERQNLTMRMGMRRFTRLTNAFSKKVENLEHAVALHFMYYNFGRIHSSLRVTPAMEAGISDHVWSLEEIIGLM